MWGIGDKVGGYSKSKEADYLFNVSVKSIAL